MDKYDKHSFRVVVDRFGSGSVRSLAIVRKDVSGNEVRDGIYIEWFETGALRHVRNYRNGVLSGADMSLSPGGLLLGSIEYENDEPKGRMMYFNPDGTCHYVGSYPEEVPYWWNATGTGPQTESS